VANFFKKPYLSGELIYHYIGVFINSVRNLNFLTSIEDPVACSICEATLAPFASEFGSNLIRLIGSYAVYYYCMIFLPFPSDVCWNTVSYNADPVVIGLQTGLLGK
jgi:hypothetical protein